MFKFLRRYSKWLLAIFGTGLMITFLVPFAIQNFPQAAAQRSATWAYLGKGEKVPRTAELQAQNELEVLDRIGVGVPAFGPMDEPEHWFLLVHEAERAGLVGGATLSQLSPEMLQQWAQMIGGQRLSILERALAKHSGVMRLMLLYQQAGKLSDVRLRREAERLVHNVDVRTVVLQAEADGNLPEPSEEEIRAQFEKFRDTAPGTVPPGFGYRIPDRFKLEWLRIPASAIRTQIEQSGEMTGIALFKHWQRNAEAQGFPPVDPAQEIPEIVRQSLLNELIAEKREAVLKFVNDRLEASRRRLARDGEGYHKLPEDWDQQKVDFVALAEEIPQQEDFAGLPTPEYVAIGDRWVTSDDIRDMTELAMAYTDKYGGRLGIPALADALREFGGDPVIMLQEGITGPPLTTGEDLLFFRIMEADPAHALEDLEQVRETVVADLKRQAHYEQLLEQQDEIEQMAREQGLLPLAMAYDSEVERSGRVGLYSSSWLDNDLRQRLPLDPRPLGPPGVGPDMATIEAIIDRALELPKSDLQATPRSDRTFVVPVEDQLALLVVEVTQQYPLNEERFAQMVASGALQAMLVDQELTEFDESVRTAFSYESLAKRHNFRLNRRDSEEEIEDVRTAAATN